MLKKAYYKCIDKSSEFLHRSWRYLVWGIIGYFLLFATFMGFFFFTGVGKWFDVIFTLGTAVLAMAIGMFGSIVLLKILGRLPGILVASIIGAIIAIYSVGNYLGPFFRMMAFTVLVLGIMIGLCFLFYKKKRKWLLVASSLITISLHVIFLSIILTEGKEGNWSQALSDPNQVPSFENPANQGELTIRHFTYGSGEDKRRKHYRDVEFQTNSVNMSSFIVHPKGLNKWYREWFWGFDLRTAPLNGHVWMPEDAGQGPFPLVLMVHGNHNMADFSDGGYAYLGELLASKGYVAVSVDENFLNSGKSGHIGWDNAGRAWLLLKHLSQWSSWNNDKNHPLYHQVDMENIALIGHSRGGEAVSIAALFNKLDRFPNNAKVQLNFDFEIKSLIGLSPGDGRFKPGDQPVELQDINYLTLQGGNDADHTNYYGTKQFERISFTDTFDGFKSSVYLYGGNHGQFNTDWEVDQPSPYWWFMNRKELMEPELQREMTKLYVAAFLEATLKNKDEYQSLFSTKDTASAWIPTDPVRLRYEDSKFLPVATFEEDVDVISVSMEDGSARGYNLQVWKEEELTLRNKDPQDNQAVKLGWKGKTGRYTISLPSDLTERFNENTILRFDAVQAHSNRYEFYGIHFPGEKPIPVTVVVKPIGVNKHDSRIKQIIEIEPTYTTNIYKFDWWNERFGNQYEHMLQTFEIPLQFLKEELPNVDYGNLEEITFEFNQTESGLIFLDNIGFSD